MPICKHLKPVSECPECSQRYQEGMLGQPKARFTYEGKPVLTQAIVDKVAKTLNKAGKFGQVRDAVQKAKPKRKAK